MRSFSLALLGGLRLSGKLRLPERVTRVAVIGGMNLDLTEAEFPASDRVTIVKLALVGGLELRLPRSARVTVRSLAIGGRRIEAGDDGGPNSPEVSVYAFALVGGVEVVRASV